MNKFVKYSIIVFLILIIVFVGFYIKLFIIGNDNYESISIDKVTVGSNTVLITGNFIDSSRAYKDYSYTQVGNELYVTITNVLVSNKYKSGSFQISIPVKGMDVKYIHLTDDKTTKVIYSKDE